MNIEIFKRNIKLQELGITKLSNKEQELLDFLNDNLTNLNSYTTGGYLGVLLFAKDKDKDNIVLNYDEENGYLYADYGKIWSFFESKFNMEYDEIQELIQWYVVDTLHLKVNHTYFGVFRDSSGFIDTLHLMVDN